MELMKKIGISLFLFIICFSIISSAYAEDLVKDKNISNKKNLDSVNSVPTSNAVLDDNEYDGDDNDTDDGDYLDDDNNIDYDDDCYCDEDCNKEDCNCLCHDDLVVDEKPLDYYQWEWKGVIHYIDLNEFNLTDEELTELFTKRDEIREEIANLQANIEKIELSRSDDILLAIDELYEAINKITNNTEFNDLLLTLKDINISHVNSTFEELKRIFESIKEDNPDEDFTEIDSLMDNLESMLTEELEKYENLTLELKDNYAKLGELFEKYPFLVQQVVFTNKLLPKNYKDMENIVYDTDMLVDSMSKIDNSTEKTVDSKDNRVDSKDNSTDSKDNSVDSKDIRVDSKDSSVDSKDNQINSPDNRVDSKEKVIGSKDNYEVFAQMKNTGIPYFSLTFLFSLFLFSLFLFSLLRINLKKKL